MHSTVTDSLPFYLSKNNTNKRSRQLRQVSRRKLVSPHEVVFYVEDWGEKRTSVESKHSKGMGLIPVPYLGEEMSGTFAYLRVEDIKLHLKPNNGISVKDHNNLLQQHKQFNESYTVINESMFKNHFSIRLIDKNVKMDGMEIIENNSPMIYKHVVTPESDKQTIPGSVLISSWIRCKEANHHDVT